MKKATAPHNRTCSELALMGLALFAGAIGGGITAVVHFFG